MDCGYAPDLRHDTSVISEAGTLDGNEDLLPLPAERRILIRSQLITARDNRARGAISEHVMGQGCLAGLR
jgi:hypothetical protein